MAVIDSQIDAEPRFPLGVVFFAFCGAIGVAIAIATTEAGWVIGSIPCWTISVCLFIARQGGFSAEITDVGLDVRSFGQFISYESMQAITVNGRVSADGTYAAQQAPIHIVHDGGTLTIPAGINVVSTDLFHFLRSRLQPREAFPLNPLLETFASEQEQKFGSDKVYRFVAREHVRTVPIGGTSAKAVGAGMLLGAVGWFVAAAVHSTDWAGGGFLLLLVGVLTLLVGRARSQSPVAHIKNWQNSGLVISPVGLALVQGPLKGRMRWDELRNVKFNVGVKSFQISSAPAFNGIVLQVDGSSIVITDLYNHPLYTLHEHILKYWQGGR